MASKNPIDRATLRIYMEQITRRPYHWFACPISGETAASRGIRWPEATSTMIHPDTRVSYINDQIGYGVFATRPIAKGTIVWVRDRFDRLYTEAEVRGLEPAYQEILEKYCFRDRQGRWVFCWDITRYVNHSFHPTCLTTPYGFEVAVVDIEAGREITNDYGCFNIIEPIECFPEAGCDRTTVMPDDLIRFADHYDKQLAAAFARLPQVPQPLSHLVAADRLQDAMRAGRGESPLESIRSCYYHDPERASSC